MRTRVFSAIVIFAAAASWNVARAEVRLNRIFSDHMVIQRNQPIRVWGWADAGEEIQVTLGEKSASAKAGEDGRWSVELPAMSKGEGLVLTAAGKHVVTIKDVIIGDVWVCSGQSNMHFPLKDSLGAAADIQDAAFPQIRHIKIDYFAPSVFPETNCAVGSPWRRCSPESAGHFTAVGFHFAREVHARTGVPIGLIDVNRGGTLIDSWMPIEACREISQPRAGSYEFSVNRYVGRELPQALDAMEKWLLIAREALTSGRLTDADGAAKGTAAVVSAKGLAELGPWIATAREALKNRQFIDAQGRRLPPPSPLGFVSAKEDPLPAPPYIPDPPNGASGWLGPGNICLLYNGMLHPVTRFPVKGVLWYQGESNALQKGGDPGYARKQQLLIESWRKAWGLGELPFYYVQLPGWLEPGTKSDSGPEGGGGWVKVQEAQRKGLALPNVGMAVAVDVGDSKDIHPKNKYDIGMRLARWALARDYGEKDLEVSGPIYKQMKIEDGKIRISFDHAGSGLMVGLKKGREPVVEDQAAKLKWFAIAGADPSSPDGSAAAGRKWVWADAVIDGQTVVVSSPEVKQPVAVRYAYIQDPAGANLYNREGLPASPFRTDEW